MGACQLVYQSPKALLTDERWRDMLLCPVTPGILPKHETCHSFNSGERWTTCVTVHCVSSIQPICRHMSEGVVSLANICLGGEWRNTIFGWQKKKEI